MAEMEEGGVVEVEDRPWLGGLSAVSRRRRRARLRAQRDGFAVGLTWIRECS